MKKILFVFGTRPEAIKVAPLIKKFQENKDYFITKTCNTGQHKEMLDQVLDFFQIESDYKLNIMTENQTLYSITEKIISKLKIVLEDFSPDYVFVHGDTSTTMAASLASFYHGAKICHIEAGLRTSDLRNPFPEEANRRITSVLANYHFCPTNSSKHNLLKENIKEENIIVTGNTVIDALFYGLEKIKQKPHKIQSLKSKLLKNKKNILITCHRRENHGEGILNVCKAIKQLAIVNENHQFIFPVHLNPKILNIVHNELNNIQNVVLIEPLDYPNFIWLMNESQIIITDSGGVQEEAPSLGKPVIVVRDETERPEAVEAGTVKLVGSDTELIINNVQELIDNSSLYNKMSSAHNPYGDGNSVEKIINFFKTYQ
ncbi:non-hydrolyzing UDP-N-acetylglucosamine 2-epimerase [Chishuiella sp.]|uniref:non-hydrolyzing UDP-N-acetylglucosamine 2-epimerase n=1 Tax=Chishuiella sp. TaxID=1969467 RepID=UPI0028AAFC70|nr:UDP-N-acetylglucosamine 2-epimerase (non-hydrolyzing) [Chishuiella sp.]